MVRVEAERVLAIADPAKRMRAYAQLSRVLAEEGETVPADVADRILLSLRGDGSDQAKEQVVTTCTEDRRRLAVMHTLRPVAAIGCAVAAVGPFALAARRWGWGIGEAVAAFLAPGWPLAGVVLALVAAGVLARFLGRAGTLEGLAWPVVGCGVAGVMGLAVARGLLF